MTPTRHIRIIHALYAIPVLYPAFCYPRKQVLRSPRIVIYKRTPVNMNHLEHPNKLLPGIRHPELLMRRCQA